MGTQSRMTMENAIAEVGVLTNLKIVCSLLVGTPTMAQDEVWVSYVKDEMSGLY